MENIGNILLNIYILYNKVAFHIFWGEHFFASNTTLRKVQGTLLLNDLVPRPQHRTNVFSQNKMILLISLFGPIPPISKYRKKDK